MTDQGSPVGNLNELEAIDGEIWANIWLTSCVARIDPQSGAVKCGEAGNNVMYYWLKSLRREKTLRVPPRT